MIDENNYPTLKYMRCKICGCVFVCSLTGNTDCPECNSYDTNVYKPYESSEENGNNTDDRLNADS